MPNGREVAKVVGWYVLCSAYGSSVRRGMCVALYWIWCILHVDNRNTLFKEQLIYTNIPLFFCEINTKFTWTSNLLTSFEHHMNFLWTSYEKGSRAIHMNRDLTWNSHEIYLHFFKWSSFMGSVNLGLGTLMVFLLLRLFSSEIHMK